MKFSEGDHVYIANEFYNNRRPGDPGINDIMRKMEGKEFIVRTGYSAGTFEVYRLYDNEWSWDGDWLESADEEVADVQEEDILNMFVTGG